VTREEWLEAAIGRLWGILPDSPSPLAGGLKVSVGWPKGARGRGGRAVGQCWGQEASLDRMTQQIFICPTLDAAKEVLPVLLHEVIHAVVGVEHKHRRPFSDMARRAGLVKPFTASVPSAGLAEKLEELAGKLGSYPHVGMVLPLKKQSTRQKLWICGHGKKVRAADSDPLDAVCRTCNTLFVREED
jgi:hypothetical protein